MKAGGGMAIPHSKTGGMVLTILDFHSGFGFDI
jgi:hypothetical protein